ncbi:DUF3717 domain-containing protein [Paraburkholderia acidisoli]|uniref:DUF3717 domain-containing protein n=1 Tax=Paraburkholderia acidisoli TaxID=2571748 RepID=A0A7Z2GQ36_9BURK|nr:DUF3717 domain-containing protein [Paraburkholderia acidisoli]QGZ65479.1 DUF3717 domain-containing protein [Paraburkholderia acidisoli]
MNAQSEPVSIAQIEAAINFWRERCPADAQNPSLCAPARALADVYGLMIYSGKTSVARAALSREQAEALAGAE